MYFNNINFPNQIVDAIQENKLVVFAGAGASTGKPTLLPNFENLAKKIAEGTGNIIGKNEPCEVFLGKLKAKDIQVNELAADILSGTCLDYNPLHEAIVDLFPAPHKIRIVTTNYDKMFEKVLTDRGFEIPVYNAPALPIGDDFNGIVHVHGNVDYPKYMVVTDDDFGKAYLTEGYASKFLVKLFEAYTVLFVGYSYKDSILRYLTRAMFRENRGNKYILTDDMESNWDVLGIEPVRFPRRGYKKERVALIKMGLCAQRGLLEWKNRLSEIADNPPQDLTFDAEVEYCLENIERARILAHSVHGVGWISFLDKKKVFDRCFSKESDFLEEDKLWADWLCDNFVGKADEYIFQLIFAHNNSINIKFANILIDRAIGIEEIETDALVEYTLLTREYLSNIWLIEELTEKLYRRGASRVGFDIYKKFFDFKLILRKRYWPQLDSLEYKLAFIGQYHEIEQTWSKIKEKSTDEFAFDVIRFVRERIESIHDHFAYVNQASKDSEPFEIEMLPLEDLNDSFYDENPILILNQMFIDAAGVLKTQNKGKLKNSLLICIDSESMLMKKIVLLAIRKTKIFTSKQTLSLLLGKGFINSINLREQVFLLVKEILGGLTGKEKDKIIDAIEDIGRNTQNRDDKYRVYNWCVWLQRCNVRMPRVDHIINDMTSKYEFEPSNHPERVPFATESEVWIPDISPLTENELKGKDYVELAHYLQNYKEDQLEGPSRYGLMKMFANCVSQDFDWAKKVLTSMLDEKIDEKDVWRSFFAGIKDSKVSLSESVSLITYLANQLISSGYSYYLADYLYQTLRHDDVKEQFRDMEDELFHASEKIWMNRSHEKPDLRRPIDYTLNTTIGYIILSWINMVSYYEQGEIPNKYRDKFEEALELQTWERNVAVCILAGHFNLLCYLDKEWCVRTLSPFLRGIDKQTYLYAWEGISFFSRRINKDTADIVSPIYYEALEHLSWLEGDARSGYIELFLVLLIYVVNNPTLKYIPTFYKNASENDICSFIADIKFRLRNMDVQDLTRWWDGWLKHFLENRKKNKPIPIFEEENKKIIELLPVLEVVFDDAVATICSGPMPKEVDNTLWYSLDKNEIADKHPHSLARVITSILMNCSNSAFSALKIRNLVDKIKGLDEEEIHMLNEALLKNNIMP